MSRIRLTCAVMLFQISIFTAWLAGAAAMAQMNHTEYEHRITSLEATVPALAADVKEVKSYQMYMLALLAALTGKGGHELVTNRKRKSPE